MRNWRVEIDEIIGIGHWLAARQRGSAHQVTDSMPVWQTFWQVGNFFSLVKFEKSTNKNFLQIKRSNVIQTFPVSWNSGTAGETRCNTNHHHYKLQVRIPNEIFPVESVVNVYTKMKAPITFASDKIFYYHRIYWLELVEQIVDVVEWTADRPSSTN